MVSKTKELNQRESIKQASQLIKHLGAVKPIRIYVELVLCFIISWSAFYLALTATSQVVIFLSLFVFMVFNYRGLTFIHEVAHLETFVKGFKETYNVLFGYYNMVPAYTHLPHRKHHSKKDYGTLKDPEYEWWTKRPVIYLFRPLVLAFLYPLFLAIRFGAYPLVYLFMNEAQARKTFAKASTFVMNLSYERPFKSDEFQMMKREDLITALVFVTKILLVSFSIIPVEVITYWYSAMILTCLMNNYRALVAHRYKYEKLEEGSATTYYEQVLDSVSIEGNILTEIWAPLSLRYHSVHHFFPNLPYYDLAKAHKIFKKSLPADHPYFRTVEKSFMDAFKVLFMSCLEEQRKREAKSQSKAINILHFD